MLTILAWGTFFAGLAGAVAIYGLFRPKGFEKLGPYGLILEDWFSSPPALLRSAAWLGVFAFVFYHVSPLVAIGILALWARRFPRHFDAFADAWLAMIGLAKQIPWRVTPVVEWLKGNYVYELQWTYAADIIAAFAIWFGVLVFVGLNFSLSLVLVGAVIAAWAYVKHVGYDRLIMKALGAF
ncbi:hypothetical protein FJY93_00620 [Candidatus Kaiserbacteria bacterium]|nr:hypothetical protein [Candidatus Kaiserbacteria bacterium]